MPTEYEKMIAGDFYKPSDPELRALAASSREKQWAFNAEPDRLKRAEIVKSWFGSTGENVAMILSSLRITVLISISVKIFIPTGI